MIPERAQRSDEVEWALDRRQAPGPADDEPAVIRAELGAHASSRLRRPHCSTAVGRTRTARRRTCRAGATPKPTRSSRTSSLTAISAPARARAPLDPAEDPLPAPAEVAAQDMAVVRVDDGARPGASGETAASRPVAPALAVWVCRTSGRRCRRILRSSHDRSQVGAQESSRCSTGTRSTRRRARPRRTPSTLRPGRGFRRRRPRCARGASARERAEARAARRRRRSAGRWRARS